MFLLISLVDKSWQSRDLPSFRSKIISWISLDEISKTSEFFFHSTIAIYFHFIVWLIISWLYSFLYLFLISQSSGDEQLLYRSFNRMTAFLILYKFPFDVRIFRVKAKLNTETKILQRWSNTWYHRI